MLLGIPMAGVENMENLIGTILIAGRLKQVMVQYTLFFTENRLIAIDIGQVPSKVYVNPMASIASGIAGGIMQGMENTKIMDLWESVVIDINSTHKPLVSYDEKLSDELISLSNISIPYDKVKSVEIRKVTRANVDANKIQYSISFAMGMLSSESFLIPGAALDETTVLLKKTPLASKIKRS